MGEKGIFAEPYCFYTLCGVFFAGCFLGVVLETVWCMLRYRKLESRRGLVVGPFNLVYGFGAVLMTIVLYPLRFENSVWIFLCGAIVGGVYEYACSVIQEKTVGTISWNYTYFPLNLHGRINLLYCFFWGFLALVWVYEVFPPLLRITTRIPLSIAPILAVTEIVFFVIDTLLTILVIRREQKRRHGQAKNTPIGAFLDRVYPTERVIRIYPNMQFDTMQNSIRRERWRHRIASLRDDTSERKKEI